MNVNQHGIGLGLSICKKIIKSINGEIYCESKINQGTKFTMLIPYE